MDDPKAIFSRGASFWLYSPQAIRNGIFPFRSDWTQRTLKFGGLVWFLIGVIQICHGPGLFGISSVVGLTSYFSYYLKTHHFLRNRLVVALFLLNC